MLIEKKLNFLLGLLPTLFAVGLMLSTKDRIPFNDGLGYDGNIYGEMIKHFPSNLKDGHLNPYYTARIAPIALCATTLDCLSIEKSNENILFFFRIANSVLFLLLHYYWYRVGQSTNLKETSYWIGYTSLFFYYCGPRVLTYYPIQCDGFAIICGIALVHYVIARNLIGIIFITVLGMLTWPICHLLGIAAVLSLTLTIPDQKTTLKLRANRFLAWFIAASLLFALAILITYLYAGPSPEARIRGLRVGTIRSIVSHIPLLILIATGLITLHQYRFTKPFFSYFSGNFFPYLAICFSLYFLRSTFISYFANESLPQPKGFEVYGPFGIYGHGSPVYQLLMGRGGDGKLLLPLICHFLSFGPVVIYTLLNWHTIIKSAHKLGFFFVISLSVFLLLSLTWESRYNHMSFPALVVIVATAINNLEHESSLNFSIIKWYSIFLIYCSRIWIPTNPIGAELSLESFVSIAHQNYLSISGGWINWTDYLFFGAIMLLAITTCPPAVSNKVPNT